MSKRSKRRKGAPSQRTAPAGPAEAQGLDDEARAARRAQQKAEWASQKKKAQKTGSPVTMWAWIGGLAAGGLIAVVGAFLLLSGGGSEGSPEPTATVDPRVAGEVDQTVELEAGGADTASFFDPTTITGNAGDIIEIVVTNTGNQSHNLTVSGADGEYGDDRDPGDDFVSSPYAISAGETVRVRVKIDEPGSYPYKCAFHPDTQKGTLVLN